MYVCLYTQISMSPFHKHISWTSAHSTWPLTPQFGMLTIEPSDRDLFQANLTNFVELHVFNMKIYKMYFSKNEKN